MTLARIAALAWERAPDAPNWPAAVADHIVGIDRGPRPAFDISHGHLAKTSVRQPYHGHLLHGGVLEEQCLGLHRVDVLAADLQHVLVATEEAEMAVGQPHGCIA